MSQEDEPLRPLSGSQRASLEEATSRYSAALMAPETGRGAAQWLKARGIDGATAGGFRLGVVDDPMPGHYAHRGRVVIPYLAADGHPLTLRFRCIEDHDHRANEYPHGKYMSLYEDYARVFNIGAIHRADDTLEITEGEFDAVVLNKLNLHAIAIPGSRVWKPHVRRMLAGFSKVRLWVDPDSAGDELAVKIERSLRSAQRVRLRADVSDTYLQGGADALLKLI